FSGTTWLLLPSKSKQMFEQMFSIGCQISATLVLYHWMESDLHDLLCCFIALHRCTLAFPFVPSCLCVSLFLLCYSVSLLLWDTLFSFFICNYGGCLAYSRRQWRECRSSANLPCC